MKILDILLNIRRGIMLLFLLSIFLIIKFKLIGAIIVLILFEIIINKSKSST